MATAIIFSPPGGGKTVNSTLIKGKNLLLSSDNSAVVLNNFKRENLTIKPIPTFKDFLEEFEKATTSKQYDTIITDCLSDLIDGYIVPLCYLEFILLYRSKNKDGEENPVRPDL